MNHGPDHAREAPAWFERALAVPFTDEYVDVAGAAVHYLAWGRPGQRGLVFVHGGAAQAHWWTHVAAHFARDHRVLALDRRATATATTATSTRSRAGPTR